MKRILLLVLHCSQVSSFTVYPTTRRQVQCRSLILQLADESTTNEESSNSVDSVPPELVLDTDAVAQQMASLRCKYPTAEADYLAAARARAALKQESRNNDATDDDWKRAKNTAMGAVKGSDADWEISAKEAGNVDSQILIPLGPTGDDDDDGEPKLMLF
jgi:hypothetical protein